MATSIDSSMGWSAIGKIGVNIPERVTIRSVEIHEPNEQLDTKGSIYLWLDMSADKGDLTLLKLFAYKPEGIEPRSFSLPYNRTFHEELQKFVIPKLMKGQVFHGRLKKGSEGEGSGSEGAEGEGKGDGQGNGLRGQRGSAHGGRGGDDRETEVHIYELPPSEYMPK